MAYATSQDLVDRYGDVESRQVADRNNDGVVDAAVVDAALADATEVIVGEGIAVQDRQALDHGAPGRHSGPPLRRHRSGGPGRDHRDPARSHRAVRHGGVMLTEIITHLKDTADCPFVDVSGALALAAVKTAPGQSPVAFVLPIADRGRLAAMTAARQHISSRLGVMLFVRQYGDTHGSDKAASLEALTAWTRASLVGWQVTADHAPMEFTYGALNEVSGGGVWWLEEFTTSWTYFA